MNDYKELGIKALEYAKNITQHQMFLSPKTGDYIKKKLDLIIEESKKRNFYTIEDLKKIENIISENFSSKEHQDANRIIQILISNGMDILSHYDKTESKSKFYEKYYSMVFGKENKELKDIMTIILKKEENAEKLSKVIIEALNEITENHPHLMLNDEKISEEFKNTFRSKVFEKIRKNEELKNDFNSVKNNIEKYLYGNMEHYIDDFYNKYIKNFSDINTEEIKFQQFIKNKIFDSLINEKLLQNKAKNFNDFFKKYIDDNVENPIEDFMGLEKNGPIPEKVNSWKKFKKFIEQLDLIKENNYLKVEQNSLKEYLDDIDIEVLRKTLKPLVNLKTLKKTKITPEKIEAIKKDIKSRHYFKATIKAFDFINDTGGLFDINGKFRNDKLIKGINFQIFNKSKVQFGKCLGKALSPKTEFDYPENLVSQCIEKYIQNLKEEINSLNSLLSQQGVKEALAMSGFAIIPLYLMTKDAREMYKSESRMVHIEETYYNFKKMLESLNDIDEIKALANYSDFIINANPATRTEKTNFKIKKINVGKSMKDFNMFISFAIRDISGIELSEHKNKIEHIDNLIKELGELDKNKNIFEIKKQLSSELREILENVILEIDEKQKKHIEELRKIKKIEEIVEEAENNFNLIKDKKEEIKEVLDNIQDLEQKILKSKTPEEKEKVQVELERLQKELLKHSIEVEKITNKIAVNNLLLDKEKLEKILYNKNYSEEEKYYIHKIKNYRDEFQKLYKEFTNSTDAKEKIQIIKKIDDLQQSFNITSKALKEDLKAKKVKAKDATDYFEKIKHIDLIFKLKDAEEVADALFNKNNFSIEKTKDLNATSRKIIEKMSKNKLKMEILINQEYKLKQKIVEILEEMSKNSGKKKNKEEQRKQEMLEKRLMIFSTYYANTIDLIKKDLERQYQWFDKIAKQAVLNGEHYVFTLTTENGETEEIKIPKKTFIEYNHFIANNYNGDFFNYLKNTDFLELKNNNKYNIKGLNKVLNYVSLDFTKADLISNNFSKKLTTESTLNYELNLNDVFFEIDINKNGDIELSSKPNLQENEDLQNETALSEEEINIQKNLKRGGVY